MKGHRRSRGAGGDDRRWPGLSALGAGVLACAAVAVAAAGEPLKEAGTSASRLSVSPWLLVIPVAALVVLAIIGVAGVRSVGGQRVRAKRSMWLTIVGLVLLVAVLSRLRPAEPVAADDPATFEIAPPAAASASHQTSWATWIVVAAGGLLAVGAVLVRRRLPRSGTRPEPDMATSSAAAALATVEASLADLADPGDPRQSVIAAYARLLDGLQDVGVGRAPAEAPFEHVTRALGALGVRPQPLRDLTALFAEARFSSHLITGDDRRAALRALEDARADLQGVAV